jgi:hypothetical protein
MRFLISYLFVLVALSLSSISCRLVPTPGGLLPPECVHSLPHNSRISRCPHTGNVLVHDENHNLIRQIPRCSVPTPRLSSFSLDDPFPSDYRGWLSYLAYNVSSHFDTFLSDFSVPDTPQTIPTMLYLFPGLQNFDWVPLVDPFSNSTGFDIIQPVLQFPADEGVEWSVKSWYVTTDSGALYSPEIVLQPGDTIFGNMTRLNETGWFVGSTSQQLQQTTAITVNYPRLWPQRWSYLTLECYGCSSCTDYPVKPIHFSQISLTAAGAPSHATWKNTPKKPKFHFCNERSQVNNDGTVDILFQ